MNIYDSNNIILHTEDRNYHRDFFTFNNLNDAKKFFLYNISGHRFLDLKYFDGKKYVDAKISDLYNY